MSFRFYDVLEQLHKDLDAWNENDDVTKRDVIDSVRDRTLILMIHVVTTPLIGTAYAYPGDLPGLENWLSSSSPQHSDLTTKTIH